MEAQRYRHRVEFQSQVTTQDPGTGDIVLTWETQAASVPAEVLTGPGREVIAGGGKFAEATARIQCRWFPGLEPTWRILWDGKVYDILSIETDATARREYRLRVKDGLTDGR